MNLLKYAWLITAIVGCSMSAGAHAQAQVTDVKGVHSLIVPYPAGNTYDITARYLQPELSKKLNATIVVENVSGASGSMAAARLINAPPKNLIMMLGSPNELALAPLTISSAHYKPQDFKMVAHLSAGNFALITRPDLPVKSVADLIDYIRTPGRKPLTYGSPGIGSVFHMAGAEFGKRLGVELSHIPYRGGAPVIQDLMSNQVDITFLPVTTSYVQMVQTGKLKVLAILADKRNSALPDVPTVEDIPELKGFHYMMWTGLFVPASTPRAIAETVGAAANEIVASDAYRQWVAERGNAAGTPMSLDRANAYYHAESQRFLDLAREVKLTKE